MSLSPGGQQVKEVMSMVETVWGGNLGFTEAVGAVDIELSMLYNLGAAAVPGDPLCGSG